MPILPANLMPLPAFNPDLKLRIYIGLLTPEGVELSGNGYARVEIPEFTVEDSLTTRRAVNISNIQFAAATGPWPLVSGFGLYAGCTGHLLCTGQLHRTVWLSSGDNLYIGPGMLECVGEPPIPLPGLGTYPQPRTIWERLIEAPDG